MMSDELAHNRTPEAAETSPDAGGGKLTQALRRLLERTARRSVTIGELEQQSRGWGAGLVILLLALPFLLPIPLPLLSTPFGIAIAVLGFRLALGLKPWLPLFVSRRAIQSETLAKLVGLAERVTRPLERLLRPRWGFMFRWRLTAACGVGIALSALILCLPLPFPFSNSLPALAIVLLSAGLLVRDGVSVLAGHAVGVAAWGYLVFWSDLVISAAGRILF